MWKEIDKELTLICNSILPNNDLSKDLKQEVLIFLYQKEGIDELYKEDPNNVISLAVRIAYRQVYEGQQYFNKYILHPYRVTEELKNYHNLKSTYETPEVEEITKELNELDKLWVSTYAKLNCSVNQMSEATNIHRTAITNRLKHIFNNIRKQSI